MKTNAGSVLNNGETFNRGGFYALLVTQFLGAFIDNVYKLIIIFSVPLYLSSKTLNDFVTPLSALLFNIPWLLFPAIAGALADRYSKRSVTIWTKVWELGVMLNGVLGVILQNPWMLFFTLFMVGMQSSFFSPAKYGILPEILPESRLSWGNGLLNMWTFMAIILGNAAGGFLTAVFKGQVYYAMVVMVVFSLMGLASAFFVTPAPPAAPNRPFPRHPWEGLGFYFRLFYQDRRLFVAMIGIAYFWFAGAVIMLNVIEFCKATMDNPEKMSGVLLAVMALGIGLGSVFAGYLSRGKIELGLMPLGAAGMTIAGFLIALPNQPLSAIIVELSLLGFSAGFFDVPLAALLQQRSPEKIKGGMIATSNLVTFIGTTLAAGLFALLFSTLHFSPHSVFFIISIITAIFFSYMCYLEPLVLLRAPFWLLDSTFYRLRVSGRKNIPDHGGALMVASHISFPDTLALMAANDREIYFVMGQDIYDVPWMRRLARFMKIIPVNPAATPEQLKEVVDRIRQTISKGHIVCVNCEKHLAKDGAAMPWHADYKQLVAGLDAPIIPVYICRLWDSIYKFKNRKFQFIWPGQFRFPIWVQIGESIPKNASAVDIRAAVTGLATDSYKTRPLRNQLLHHAFIRTARRSLRYSCIADATSGELSYFKTLVGSIVFARKLKTILDDSNMVGVLVPPSVGGLLTNVALQMLGRVPVNLNYTTSAETMDSCAKQCGITQVLTSQKFLERLPLKVPGQTILLEDIRETITGKDRLIGMLFALFASIKRIEKHLGAPPRTPQSLATVVFSSGSEGTPKGIMLTHRNVLTQTETVAGSFPHDRHTCIIGFLPFFHSFGFTGTLWMPIVNGVRGLFHPNPLEPRVIGSLVQKFKGNILMGTNTFLQGFIRRCTPEQLSSLEFIVTGAEKLSERVRHAFKEKFGVEPMEGYGTTECSPVVAMNLPDSESPGFFHRSLRHGTIGRPLSGISIRIADPDTGEILPIGRPGLMEVCGPNTMQGYLNQPEKTASVLKDGWYSTGDIALLDDEGFITITDRLARFSKIAGEMVSHTRVEETLHNLLDLTEMCMAVASVPDVQKGERLVVLHTLTEEQLEELLARLDSSKLPNLWRPRANAFYRVEAIPVLGTGKMDIKAVKTMATRLDIGE